MFIQTHRALRCDGQLIKVVQTKGAHKVVGQLGTQKTSEKFAYYSKFLFAVLVLIKCRQAFVD